MQWLKQRCARMGVISACIIIFVLCITCLGAAAENNRAVLTSPNLIQEFDIPMSPYSAVTVRIYGNATLMVNDKAVRDRGYLQIQEDEDFMVTVQPEYGFHLVSLEFEGEPLTPVSSTTYKRDTHKDGTLTAVLTRWNADIPVTFSIEDPYLVKVYGTKIHDQQTINCYPGEELELVIDAPPSAVIAGDLNEKPLLKINDHTFLVSVAEPGTLRIGNYSQTDQEKASEKRRFVPPNPVITPSFV